MAGSFHRATSALVQISRAAGHVILLFHSPNDHLDILHLLEVFIVCPCVTQQPPMQLSLWKKMPLIAGIILKCAFGVFSLIGEY